MKNYAERKFAVRVMKKALGFAPPMTKIIPLVCLVSGDIIHRVMFQVEGNDKIIYRASDGIGLNGLNIELNCKNQCQIIEVELEQ